MTPETGKRRNGAAAAMLAVPIPRVDTKAHLTGGCVRRFCCRRHFVRHCLRVIRAGSPLKTAFFILLATEGRGVLRRFGSVSSAFREKVFRGGSPDCQTMNEGLDAR